MVKAYKVFLEDETWVIPSGTTTVDVLLVAGGGAGQGKQVGNIAGRGGGGAGGVLQVLSHTLVSSGATSVVVGKGGTSGPTSTSAISGTNSEFDGLIAIGGGRGGASAAGGEAENGGSGGGTGSGGTPGSGTPGQGFGGGAGTGTTNGHIAGGGGGATEAGENGGQRTGGKGGDGFVLTGTLWEPLITVGIPPAVAGGGGGGAFRTSGTQSGGEGGLGGGGPGGNAAANTNLSNGFDAVPGTGSGGGGAAGNSSTSGNARNGGNGADGFIAIRSDVINGPAITNISPVEGHAGTAVTLTGSNFTDLTGLLLGSTPADNFTVIDDNTLIFNVPVSEGVLKITLVSPSGYLFFDETFRITVDSRITQLPIYVIDNPNSAVHYTQIPLYYITIPVQPIRFTQVPIKVINTPRPVPFPLPVVPELPMRETWEWSTSVNIKDRGTEQRSLLRETPRKRISVDGILLDDIDYRHAYSLLWKYQGKEFLYPMYQYGSFLSVANLGDSELFFDRSLTDIRVGDNVAVFSENTGETHFLVCHQVNPNGILVEEPIDFNIGVGWQICPAPLFHLNAPGTLSSESVSGTINFVLETTRHRFLYDGVVNPLTTYDGFIVLDKRPLSPRESSLSRNVDITDSGLGLPLLETKWRTNFATSNLSFSFNRYTDMNYWYAFVEATRGRQVSFLAPTFLDDLPLHSIPATGATVLVTSNIHADAYLDGPANRYVRIERQNGIIFRRILDRKLVYDANGDPEALMLFLNQSIGSGVGSNIISKISFAPITRLDSDTINLSHGPIFTTIDLAVRTVEA